MQLIITPKTKIRELIDAYPELEEALIEMAPAFCKLKNPLLRKTIARVTTLNQAAAVGKVNAASLVNRLRTLVGQSELASGDENFSDSSSDVPFWFNPEKVIESVDARPMLAQGIHPVTEVFERLTGMQNGEILLLISGFPPAPLIDKAKNKGYEVFMHQKDEDEFHTFFLKS